MKGKVRTMKALLLNVQENRVEQVNPCELEDYYELIGCKTIDIANRSIAGKRYDIICDDEGLLVENHKISAIDGLGQPMLVGNLIIAGEADAEGNLTALSDADIEHIQANINMMRTRKCPKRYCMLCQVEY